MRTSCTRMVGSTTTALLLCVVALLAPRPALTKSGVANEDSIKSGTPPGVSKGSKRKIVLVAETLKDILQSVMNEEASAKNLFNKYAAWCKSEHDGMAGDITEIRTELGNGNAFSEEQLSIIDSLSLFIKKSDKEIQETRDAIAQATGLRNDQHDQYIQDMQANTESLHQIDLAIDHVTKVQHKGGFLQKIGSVKEVRVSQPAESSYVLGVMRGLKEKLMRNRASMQKEEGEKSTMHDSFQMTKGTSLKFMTDTATEKKILLTETTAQHSGVKRRIGRLTEELAKFAENSHQTEEACQTARQAFALRKADRANEQTALTEAIRYLNAISLQKASLVQSRRENDKDEEHASVVSSPSFLQSEADSDIDDAAFDQATSAAFGGEDGGAHMPEDTLNGVKKVVSNLIATHQDTQRLETVMRSHCEQEIEAKEGEELDTTDALDAVEANIEKKTSEVQMLAHEVKELYTSTAVIRRSLEIARKVRKEEMAFFESGSKDRILAQRVLKQAMAVLQKFYETEEGSLQQHAGLASERASQGHPSPGGSSSTSRKTAASFGAMSLLQEIVDDVNKEQKHAILQEKQATDAFATHQQDSQQDMDDKHQDITDRVKQKAKLGVQINTLKETRTEKSDDLNAIHMQLDGLHKHCDELLKFYDQRQKSRSFEVDQLRDAMDILHGSTIAARTDFMQ